MKKRLLVELANLTPRAVPANAFFQTIADVAAKVEGLRRIRRIGQIGPIGQTGYIRGQALKMSVVFVSGKFLRALNRKLRKQSYQCQELSLAFGEAPPGLISGEYLGEILLTPTKSRNYAGTFIHALLHILGYNHEGRAARHKRDALLMAKIEQGVLKKLEKKGLFKSK